MRANLVLVFVLSVMLCACGSSSGGDGATGDQSGTSGADTGTSDEGTGGSTSSGTGECNEGDFNKCECLDGSAGFSNCNADGNGFGPCTCGIGSGTEGLDVDTYVANLEKSGVNGNFSVKLVESTPIPKDLEFYNWTIQVLDSAGQPIDGAAVEAEPMMPAHGHGTYPPVTIGAATGESGTYELIDMDLFMPGTWRVTIRVESGELKDEVEFHFDLDG
ncbi:MAG TPA: hypothetical protein EYN06_07455 [Myxococcales bacterium]|nr:hypothetical protein [Myxococcales bacterium]